MAAHPLFCALRVGSVWQDVSADVHQGNAVRVVRGAKDESGGLTAAKAELRLLDLATAAPAYDPDHPLSALYGLVGQNTRMIVGLDLVTETFEAVTPVVPRTDAGTAFWTRSNTDAHTGAWSLKAGTVGNSQVSDVTLTTPAGATACVFWYKVSSQDPGDGLQVLVDGVNLIVNLAGVTSWLQIATKCNPGGSIRFRYTKDAAGSAGADTAWIDDVRYYNSRAVVEASSWKPDEELGFHPQTPGPGLGSRWTDLQGEGILRRIGQWKDALRSPVYRQITSRIPAGRLLGYWPGEDKAGSTGLTNALPGGQPGFASGVTYAGGEQLSGTDALIKLGATSKLSGRFVKPTGTVNGWQISFAFKLDAAAPSLGQVITWTTSNGYRYFLNVSATQYQVQCLAPDGVTYLDNVLVGFSGSGDPSAQGVVFRIKCTATAGTVSLETAWYSQDFPTPFGITDTFTGTTGYLLSWAAAGNPAMDGATFGQVYAVAGGTDDLQDYNTLNAFNGYRGELAGYRFLRLLGYFGIYAEVLGNVADTQPMGPQRPDRLIELLKEIQRTEDGPLFDMAWRTGLYLRARASMLNQAAKLTLTKAQCAQPLAKVTDDLVSGNRVTVRNRTGGEATFEIVTGPGSTLDAPAGVGLYEQTVDVNVADDADLDELAGRWAYKLSDTTPRYSSVTVDLDAQPGLETAVGLVEIGDRIVLSDVRPGGVGLIVLGYTDAWDTKFRRKWTAVCSPDTLYNPGRYDTAAVKYDSKTSTLAVARDTVQTAWTITTTDLGDVWSTTGVPYGWVVAGETMTVTAMGVASGTGPYTQNATVTRGTNGIVKAHLVGEEIHISPRVRYG